MPVTSTDKTLERAMKILEVAIEKKARNPVILNLKDISIIADYFIIFTGYSAAQNRAISDAIDASLPEEGYPLKREGYEDAAWILMDYRDLVIHIFQEDLREYYDLEGLWGDAPKVNLSELVENIEI